MLTRMQKLLGRMRGDESGNATLLVAIGMPVLIGSSGIAVDFAQWYMWKRELQYAVDQAAIAGAWARSEPEAQDDYVTRAKTEFNANLANLTSMATTPVVTLEDFESGTDNSVQVVSSASSTLPFTQMVIGRPVTVRATAQATFEAATNFTTCLLALDPSADAAFELGGTASGTVTCGGGAISSSATAMVKNGNPTAQLGFLVAGGGIDPGYASNGTINENVSNLSDPYEGLTPPTSPTGRTYACPTGSSTTASGTTADVTTTTTLTYTYWQGRNQSQATQQVTFAGGLSPSVSTTVSAGESVANGTQEGFTQIVDSSYAWTGRNWTVAGSRNDEIYEKQQTVVEKTYDNVTAGGTTTTSTGAGTAGNPYNVYPGTYTNISINCVTNFMPGVYVVTGNLDFGQNKLVTGSDVMFVLESTGAISVNSTSKLVMSGITAETLMNSYGMSAESAALLDSMLIYDPDSTDAVTINGGSQIAMEGIIYMPEREVTMNGNSAVNGNCLMLAANKLKFTGTNDLSSFCLPAGSSGFDIGGTTVQVRLVA